MIHHLAIAVKDVRRSHHFYTEVMGFELAKVVKVIKSGELTAKIALKGIGATAGAKAAIEAAGGSVA